MRPNPSNVLSNPTHWKVKMYPKTKTRPTWRNPSEPTKPSGAPNKCTCTSLRHIMNIENCLRRKLSNCNAEIGAFQCILGQLKTPHPTRSRGLFVSNQSDCLMIHVYLCWSSVAYLGGIQRCSLASNTYFKRKIYVQTAWTSGTRPSAAGTLTVKLFQSTSEHFLFNVPS